MDYRTENNSGIIMVKWVDNSVVQLVSNFCGIKPMSKISQSAQRYNMSSNCNAIQQKHGQS